MPKRTWTEKEESQLRTMMCYEPRPSYNEMARVLGKTRGKVAGKIALLEGRPGTSGPRRPPPVIPLRLARWVGYFRAAGWSPRVIYRLFDLR